MKGYLEIVNIFLSIKIGRTRMSDFLTSILFVILYRHIHSSYLVEVWKYFGYRDLSGTFEEILYTNIMSIIPIIFYSGEKVISNFISIMIYVLAYVPTIITIQFQSENLIDMAGYQFAYLFAMVLFFMSDRYTPQNQYHRNTEELIPLEWWVSAGILLSISVVMYFGLDALRLVSFDEVYELRSENRKLQDTALIGYFTLWIARVFLPLFMGIGLVYKKKSMIILGVLMSLLVYMSMGAKTTISLPFLAIGMYICLKHIGFKYIFPCVVAAFATVFILYKVFPDSTVVFSLSALLLMRTLGISGLLATAYMDFFTTAPYTYYTHIGIVNRIFGGYPYGNVTLGKAVWARYNGIDVGTAMNANANFWVTDGVAAAGIFGVIAISILLYFILKYLNKISERHDMDFVCILFLGIISGLLNVSLFTVIISCGLFLIIIFLKYSTVKPNDYEENL